MTFPAFKAGDSALSEPSGEFDSHTLPPQISCVYAGSSGSGVVFLEWAMGIELYS